MPQVAIGTATLEAIFAAGMELQAQQPSIAAALPQMQHAGPLSAKGPLLLQVYLGTIACMIDLTPLALPVLPLCTGIDKTMADRTLMMY